LQRGEAILGRERDEFDLARVVEDRGRDRAAKFNVETAPVALVVGKREPGDPLVDAAKQRSLVLHGLERLGTGGRNRKAERESYAKHKDFAFHGTALGLTCLG
jgi:hypothetical protein